MGGSSPSHSIGHTNAMYTYLGQNANVNPLLDMGDKYAGLANQASDRANALFGGSGVKYGSSPMPGAGGGPVGAAPGGIGTGGGLGGGRPKYNDPGGGKDPLPMAQTGGGGETALDKLLNDAGRATLGGTGGATGGANDPGSAPGESPTDVDKGDPAGYGRSPASMLDPTNSSTLPEGGLVGSYADLASGRRTEDEQKVGNTYSSMMTNGGYSDAAKASMQQQAASALQGQQSAAKDQMARRMATTGNAAGGYGAMARLSGSAANTASNQARQNVIDWENKKQQDQLQGAAGMSAYNQQGRSLQQQGLAGQQGLYNTASSQTAGYYGALRDILGTKQSDRGEAYQFEMPY